MSRKPKHPASGEPTGGKHPKSVTPDYEERTLRFRFGKLDHHQWPLGNITKEHHKRLLKRLAYFEQLTVTKAKANKVLADYDMAECPNQQAAKRLTSQYDGADSLCCLKIAPSENLRLLGIRELNEFHIIWWDAAHDIWPEGKIKR